MTTPEDGKGVQELHGIFQFTDDLFEERVKSQEYVLPNYCPREVNPGWFMNITDKNGHVDPLAVKKHALEYLYYLKEYKSAFNLVQELLQKPNSRREIIESALQCALKVGDNDCANKCFKQLDALTIDDSSLAYVLSTSYPKSDDA